MCTKEGKEGILTSPVSACATGPSDSQGLGGTKHAQDKYTQLINKHLEGKLNYPQQISHIK